MINLLFFIGCFIHSKPKFEYFRIGVVDRAEDGICVIEIDDALFFKYSPTTIHVYSKKCKDGDIIAIGRRKK